MASAAEQAAAPARPGPLLSLGRGAGGGGRRLWAGAPRQTNPGPSRAERRRYGKARREARSRCPPSNRGSRQLLKAAARTVPRARPAPATREPVRDGELRAEPRPAPLEASARAAATEKALPRLQVRFHQPATKSTFSCHSPIWPRTSHPRDRACPPSYSDPVNDSA